MSDLKARFEAAATAAKRLPKRPDNDTLLQMYALYKQASEGDVSGNKPGMFDMVGQAKYQAWSKLKGTAQESAMQQYIELVDKLS